METVYNEIIDLIELKINKLENEREKEEKKAFEGMTIEQAFKVSSELRRFDEALIKLKFSKKFLKKIYFELLY